MALILNLETATTNCSVSLAKDGELLAILENDTPNYSHSEQLHVFIEKVLSEASVGLSQINAIAISKGPGSYTGLRIGVSAAKGLCYALEIPLIAIPTLESIVCQVNRGDVDFVIPLLDARRMEVYSAVYDKLGKEIRETRAELITETSFEEYARRGKVILAGSGAMKCEEILDDKLFEFKKTIVPSAREMATLSYEKYKRSGFEDVAYFEPYYLKDFILQGKV